MALSRFEMESLPPFPDAAVISVTSPGLDQAKISDFPFVHRISFSDVDHLTIRMPTKPESVFFSEEMAEGIRSFVKGLPKSIRTVVVNCEGGHSRSTGVALWMVSELGYEAAPFTRLGSANASVWSMLSSKPVSKKPVFKRPFK